MSQVPKARPMTYGKSKRGMRTHAHAARTAQFSDDDDSDGGEDDSIKQTNTPSGITASNSKSSVASTASSRSTTRRAPLSEKDPNKPRTPKGDKPTLKARQRPQKTKGVVVPQATSLHNEVQDTVAVTPSATEGQDTNVEPQAVADSDPDTSFSIIVPPARRFRQRGGTYGRQAQNGPRRAIAVESDTSESEGEFSHQKDSYADSAAKRLECFVEVPPTPHRRPLQSRNARATGSRRQTVSRPPPNASEQLSAHLDSLQLNGSSSKSQDSLTSLLCACHQMEPASFAESLTPLGFHARNRNKIEKAGEASYSEVFRLRGSKKSGIASILKIIPLRADDETASHGSLASEVYREVAMTEELARDSDMNAPGFITLHSAAVVRGAYPPHLVSAWDAFEARDADDVDPRTYEAGQLFCLLNLSDGGVDLENIVLQGWSESLAIFAQVVDVLAEAETRCSFEHRDLHWGNVVIQRQLQANKQSAASTWEDLRKSSTSGLRTQLIDFTLSRMTIAHDQTLSFDLTSEPTLFEGDATDDYQFEVYRLMRTHLSTLDNGRDDWTSFAPGTNVIWLHYLARKLLEEKAPVRKKGSKTAVHTAHDRLIALEEMLAKQVNALCISTKDPKPRRPTRPSSRRNASVSDQSEPSIGSARELRKWCQRMWE